MARLVGNLKQDVSAMWEASDCARNSWCGFTVKPPYRGSLIPELMSTDEDWEPDLHVWRVRNRFSCFDLKKRIEVMRRLSSDHRTERIFHLYLWDVWFDSIKPSVLFLSVFGTETTAHQEKNSFIQSVELSCSSLSVFLWVCNHTEARSSQTFPPLGVQTSAVPSAFSGNLESQIDVQDIFVLLITNLSNEQKSEEFHFQIKKNLWATDETTLQLLLVCEVWIWNFRVDHSV